MAGAPNPFDQFGFAPGSEPAPSKAVPPSAVAPGTNPFDQFDEKAAAPRNTPEMERGFPGEPDWMKDIAGVGIDIAGDVIGSPKYAADLARRITQAAPQWAQPVVSGMIDPTGALKAIDVSPLPTKEDVTKFMGGPGRVADNPLGRQAQQITRMAGDIALMGGGAGPMTLLRGAGATYGQDIADWLDTKLDPEGKYPLVRELAGFAGGAAGGFAPDAALAAGAKIAAPVAAAARPFYKGGQERLAGETILGASSAPEALRDWAAGRNPPPAGPTVPPGVEPLGGPPGASGGPPAAPGPSPIPDFQRTTAQTFPTDTGLAQLERSARMRPTPQPTDVGAASFLARGTQQGEALAAHLGKQAPTEASAAAPGRFFADRLQELDDMHGGQVAAAQEAARVAVEGGPGRPGIGGTALDTREQYGQALRAPAAEQAAIAKAGYRSLYDAVDPEGNMVVPPAPFKTLASGIEREIVPGVDDKPPAYEASLYEDIKNLPDTTPFSFYGNKLRPRINDAISKAYREGNNTAAARLVRLKEGFDGALNEAVNLQAGVEDHLAQTGRMAPEDTIRARLLQERADFYARQAGEATGSGGRGAAGYAGGGPGAVSGAGRAAGPGERGPANAPGAPGAPPAEPTGLTPEALAKYREAVQAYRDYVTTYRKGAAAPILAREGNQPAGAFKLSDSQIPARLWSGADRTPAAIDNYIQMAGGRADAIATLRDYAAFDLRREAMRPDGTINPKKLDAWLAEHDEILRNPAFAGLRERFETAGAAQRMVEDALARRKLALQEYEKSAAQHFLGNEPKEAVAAAFRKNAQTTMRELVRLAGEDRTGAALEGLKRAVVDYVLDRYKTSFKGQAFQQLQDFIGGKMGALGELFGPEGATAFKQVAEELERMQAVITRSKAPTGGSDTAANLAAAKYGREPSLLSRIVTEATMEAGGAAIGAHVGGIPGGIMGFVTGRLLAPMRAAGLAKVDNLVAEAMLDPAKAKLLLTKVPPEGPVPAPLLRQLGSQLRQTATNVQQRIEPFLREESGGVPLTAKARRELAEARRLKSAPMRAETGAETAAPTAEPAAGMGHNQPPPERPAPPKTPGRDGLINPLPTPADLPAKLNRALNREVGVGAPKNDATRLAKGVYLGKVSLPQWLERTQSVLSPDEITEARNWYRDALPVYERYFGKEKAPAMLGAWLTANVNATPSFAQLSATRALEQYVNKTGEFSPQKKGGLAHDKLMRYWDAIVSGDLSKLGEEGSGQKIYDFIDSALMKNTRTYYGDDPRAGAPAVADVHSLRDMGFVDEATLNWVEQNYGKAARDKLARDSEGLSPGEAQYEWAADKMRAFTKALNKRGFMGGNWTPQEVQAVGWTTMAKMLGRKPETPGQAIVANIRNLSYELDPGAGSPNEALFAGLDGNQKAAVAEAVMPHIVDLAKTITGAQEFTRVAGLGGWHEFTNPSFKSRFIASPEVAGDVADIIGYLAQQTKVMGYRWQNSGDRLGVAIYGPALNSPEIVSRMWSSILKEHPDFAAGFSPSRNADGTPGIEIILDKGGKKMQQRVEQEFVPGIHGIGQQLGLDLRVEGFSAAEESRSHDWTQDPKGGSYLARLGQRYGPAVPERLELYQRQELGPRIRDAIGSVRKGPGVSEEPERFGQAAPRSLTEPAAGGPQDLSAAARRAGIPVDAEGSVENGAYITADGHFLGNNEIAHNEVSQALGYGNPDAMVRRTGAIRINAGMGDMGRYGDMQIEHPPTPQQMRAIQKHLGALGIGRGADQGKLLVYYRGSTMQDVSSTADIARLIRTVDGESVSRGADVGKLAERLISDQRVNLSKLSKPDLYDLERRLDDRAMEMQALARSDPEGFRTASHFFSPPLEASRIRRIARDVGAAARGIGGPRNLKPFPKEQE